MSTSPMHWAADLIGKPYSKTPAAPASFSCWTMVRYVFEHVHHISMPHVNVGQVEDGSADNVAAIKRAAAVSGWRPVVDAQPAEHDIVLMDGIEGRHVGVMVMADGHLRLLHCIDPQGVCVQTLDDLRRVGFANIVFWRRYSA